jgi:hypothetical protein
VEVLILELHISKRQSKGLFGGVKLGLTQGVQLTDEEEKLLQKYKSGNDILYSGSYNGEFFQMTVNRLIKKGTTKHSKIEELNENIKIINESYKALKEKIEALKKFEEETL